MSLDFDPACRSAVNLAKSALAEGTPLDVAPLLDALYHATDLKQRLPDWSGYFQAPQPIRPPPPEVPVADGLKPVLSPFAQQRRPVTADALFLALLRSPQGRDILRSRGLTEERIAQAEAALAPAAPAPVLPAAPAAPPAPAPAAPSAGQAPPPPPGSWRTSADRDKVAKGLSAFGRMMTEGDLPDRGTTEMEPALEALVTVLVSRKRRNAIVTGLPGTGKTAVIRELARRIVARDERIPAMLHDYDIFELSPLFLRSGASVVGQYEERIKALIQVLTEHPKVILFVDEIHSLFESDMHGGGPFAGANEAFKGVLNRGDIICIGCTTTAEYRHYIQPNKALARRFKEIKLEPPSAETALRILQSRLAHVAEHYAGLRIPESILPRVVELAEEFLPAQYQPDKSIQLLDQACAWCMVKRRAAGEVDEEALVHALEHTLGRRVVRPEQLTKDQVLERLNRKIVGQDKVLEGVAQAFITGLSQWSRHEGPRGAFFFGGPTGVGKTEVALMLAEIYGGDRSALIRVDCNTLQGSGYDDGPIRNILLGVPPGYVGYVLGQGGLLSRIRDFPASIVLFDEFEKASPGVGNLLLAILDKGQAEDTDGNLLDFRHAFFVFTSNAGCSYGDSGFIGYQIPGLESDGVPKANKQAITEELIRRVGLGREFIGRLSHVFIFNGLDSQAIGKVLLDKLAELVELAKGRGYGLTWDDGLVEHLVRRWQPQFGVRFLTNMLHNRIVERLSVAEAQGKLKGVTTIRVTAGKLPEGAEAPELVGAASHEQEGDTLVIRVV